MRTIHRFRLMAFTLTAVLLGAAGPALSARFIPGPILLCLTNGYGVVSAEVTTARCTNGADQYPASYDVTFKVHEVLVQPLRSGGSALRSGDKVELQISAGYACQLEDDPKSALATGKAYYLVLKQNGDGSFVAEDGASAVQPVSGFDQATDKVFQRLGALAAVAEGTRMAEWIQVLKDPAESDRLRSEVLYAVREVAWRSHSEKSTEVHTALLAIWNDPKSNLSVQLMEGFDYALRLTGKSFDESPERRKVWLTKLLTLTPEMKKDDNDRDNNAFSMFCNLAITSPSGVASELEPQLMNKDWPPLYRRGIASGLLSCYVNADSPDQQWEKTLRAYFIDLMQEGDPYPIRVAAGDLEFYSGAASNLPKGVKRRYVLDTEELAAIHSAVARLTTTSARPGADQEYSVAASELARVSKVLDRLEVEGK